MHKLHTPTTLPCQALACSQKQNVMYSPQGRSEAAVAALEMCLLHGHRCCAVTRAVLWGAVGWNPCPVLGQGSQVEANIPHLSLSPISQWSSKPSRSCSHFLSPSHSQGFPYLPRYKRCVLGFSSLQEESEIFFRENYGFSPQCVAIWNSQALSFGLIFPRSIKSARFLAN